MIKGVEDEEETQGDMVRAGGARKEENEETDMFEIAKKRFNIDRDEAVKELQRELMDMGKEEINPLEGL